MNKNFVVWKRERIGKYKIEYNHFDWIGDLDDSDKEHILQLLIEGYISGELNTGVDEHRGWWRKI